MTRAYIGLGGNLGDRQANLEKAGVLLREAVEVVRVSALYETAPVGFTDQPSFLNAAAAVETNLEPCDLLDVLQEIERVLGKATPFKNGPRAIDLDLLLYGAVVLDETNLSVPHPRMHERRFVLVPLAEIAPRAVHPLLAQPIADLLTALPANGGVRAWRGVSNLFPTPPGV